MCLNLRKNYEKHIAKEDIYTIKILGINAFNQLGSPVIYYRWALLKTNPKVTIVIENNNAIEQGYHSIRLDGKRVSFTRFGLINTLFYRNIFLAKIPKGSIFYVGDNTDVVSNNLIIIEQLYSPAEKTKFFAADTEYICTNNSKQVYNLLKRIVRSYNLNTTLPLK